MRVLGLESSTAAGSAAVVEGERLLGEVWFAGVGEHSQKLLASVARVLEITGTHPGDLDGVSVGLGPGSFTGVRVGLSTAKGLALGLGLPLVGVSTLEALAAGASQCCGLVCPMVDARAQRVYTALFRASHGWMEQVEEGELRDLAPWLLGLEGPVLFLGDGALSYKELIRQVMGEAAHFSPAESCLPRAATVARLGAGRLGRGEHDNLDLLGPIYTQEAKAVRDMVSKAASTKA